MSDVTLEKLAARVDAMRDLQIMVTLALPPAHYELICNTLAANAATNTADSAYARELEQLAEDLKRIRKNGAAGSATCN